MKKSKIDLKGAKGAKGKAKVVKPAGASKKPQGTVKKAKKPKIRRRDLVKPHCTPYIHYSTHTRAAIKKDHPEMKQPEIVKELGRRWKELTEEEKLPWKQMSDRDKERHTREFAALSLEDQARYNKAKVRRKKKDKDHPTVKTAFILFSQKLRPEIYKENPNVKFTEAGVILGKRWHAMSQEEKKPYYDAYEAEKEKAMAILQQRQDEKKAAAAAAAAPAASN